MEYSKEYSRNDIQKSVYNAITKLTGIPEEKIKLNSLFVEDLSFDELDCVEMMMKMEDDLEITLPDDDIITGKTVSGFIDYLEKNHTLVTPSSQKELNKVSFKGILMEQIINKPDDVTWAHIATSDGNILMNIRKSDSPFFPPELSHLKNKMVKITVEEIPVLV